MTPKKPIMRGFTDDDIHELENGGMKLNENGLKNLLARLRAAEVCVDESLRYPKAYSLEQDGYMFHQGWHEAYEAWLASKGEGERNG